MDTNPLPKMIAEATHAEDAYQAFWTVSHPQTFSGWKLHLRSIDADGTEAVALAVLDFVKAHGLGMKVATPKFFRIADDSHPQHGKGVTVYLPKLAEAEAHMAELVRLADGMTPAGDIDGDEMVAPNVGRRWELADGAPDRDLDADEYQHWYQAAEAYR